MSCCVVGCKNRKSVNTGLKFYRIPSSTNPFNANRRRRWLQAIRRDDWKEEQIKNARLCSAHFISGEVSTDFHSPDFVPSVFSYSKQHDINNCDAKLERKKMTDDRPITIVTLCVPSEAPKQECSINCPAEADVPVTRREYDDLKQRHSQLQEDYVLLCQQFDRLQAENVKLKEELQKSTFLHTTVKESVHPT